MRAGACLLALLLASFCASPASAQPASSAGAKAMRRVAFSGSMGDRAVLVIDGQLRTLAPGAVERGVRFIGMQGSDALVDIDGRRALLRMGAAPLALSETAQGGGGSQIVMSAGLGGHFTTSGSINGRAVEFLVDTGATAISMSQAEADRIGLAWRTSARRALTQTANGPVPVSLVLLDSVRIGDVEVFNVEAAIVPAAMSHVLLGNSFLTRFQMRRDNDTLTLVKRP
jgi:aspartyl protease family protein